MTSSKIKKETMPVIEKSKDLPSQAVSHKTAKTGLLFLIFAAFLAVWLFFALDKKPQKPIVPSPKKTEQVLKTIEPSVSIKTVLPHSAEVKANQPEEKTLQQTPLKDMERQKNQAYIDSLQTEIKVLKNQLENLSHQNIEEKKYADSLLALYDAIQKGRPFKKEIARVLKINPTDTLALSVQEKTNVWAATGIPTLTELQIIFQKESQNAEQSFYIHPQMNWQDEVIAFFKSAIHVRPIQIKQKNLKGVYILYAIEDALNSGHLDKAVSLLNKLSASEKMLLSTFIKQAEMRLQINTLLQQYISHSGE